MALDEPEWAQSSHRGGTQDTPQMEQSGRHQALTHHILGWPIYSSKKLKEHNNDLLCCQHTQCPLIRGLNGSIMIIKSHVLDFRCTIWQAHYSHPPLVLTMSFQTWVGITKSPQDVFFFFLSVFLWRISTTSSQLRLFKTHFSLKKYYLNHTGRRQQSV